MAPPCPRAAAAPRGPQRTQRPASCSPNDGASHGTRHAPCRPPDPLISRLEAVDREATMRKFARYGRPFARVDHISGTQADASSVLQSTMLLQEDGLLAARLDDVTYLLDGLQTSTRTPRGRLSRARNVLELTKLLQEPRVLQAIALSSLRRRTQDRTRQLLTQDAPQEETLRAALTALVYVLSTKSETQDFIDLKVLDAVVRALKREVVGDAEEREVQAEEKEATSAKKTCLKRKNKKRDTQVGVSVADDKKQTGNVAGVSDETCTKLLGEVLHGHEVFLVEGELLVSTEDTLCAALANVLRVDGTDVATGARGAGSGDAAEDTFKLIEARKRQLVRNGGVDVLVYGLANRLRILERLLPSSLAEGVRDQFAHCLHRVSMLLCVFEQVTFLMVDVQQYISQHQTLFVLLFKLIRWLSELSWRDPVRTRWESESTRMSLAVEVLLSALRVLLNLTHHSAEAAAHVHALGGMQLLANSFSQLWGLVRSANQLQHSQVHGKWEYDACLLLLSVMINSIELSGENHASLSGATLFLSVGNDVTKVSACDLFTQFFLAKVESYVDLINLTENGGTSGAVSIPEESYDWNPEDVILAGCASLLLGYLMKGSSDNSAAILKLLPDNSTRLLLRALGVFVAFHSQMDALTPEVAKSALLIETVFKSYQGSGLGAINCDALTEMAEQVATPSNGTDIDVESKMSVEDAHATRSSGASSSPVRARQLKNVCSNIDDSDEENVPYSRGRKLEEASNAKSEASSQSSQAVRMRTPTRTPPRSSGKTRHCANSPMKTPSRLCEKSPSRDSVTAVLPDGSLSSPVVARLLKRTRQLVDEFDADSARSRRFSPQKRGGGSSEETVVTDIASSSCVVLSMDMTCRDNGSPIMPMEDADATSSHSSPVVARLLKRTRQLVDEFDADFTSPSRSSFQKRNGGNSVETVVTDITAVRPDGSRSLPVVAQHLKRTRQLVDEFDADSARSRRFSPQKRGGGSSEETVVTDIASSSCVVLSMDMTCRDNGSQGLDLSQDMGKENCSNLGSNKVCADAHAELLSSKRKKKPIRNPDASSKRVTTIQDTSFGFTAVDSPPSTPLRKKSKVLLQSPTRNGRYPGLYRQSPSLNLTPTKTSPSIPLRIKKSSGLLRIPSKNTQPPNMDQSMTSVNPHRRKMKGNRAPSAPASSVFDFTD